MANGKDVKQEFAGVASSLESLRTEVEKLLSVLRDKKGVAPFTEEQQKIIDRVKEARSEMKKLGETVFNDVGESFKKVIRDGDGFQELLGKIKDRVQNFVLETAVINPIKNSLFGQKAVTVDDYFVGNPENDNKSLFGQYFGGLFGSGGSARTATTSPTFVTNITTPDAGSFRAAQGQVLAGYYRQLSRAARFV